MLTNDRERAICAKYSARGEDGNVNCHSCPLVKSHYALLCKANSSYNRSTGEWEPDEVEGDAEG